ncbi:DinB family protein [Rhodococcus sp. IEGM 1330]|uniref:DinB family protein n=1 Tax=Rhodococcus sp. IEGM 1330 TaxID=3082225 RepID=UPI0029547204|nr:DinB family protein [Rhodococcus sp. IEGM 1330]MDV8021166.1 DinB family protein [Rhodococcus sp. IEGM 1330]
MTTENTDITTMLDEQRANFLITVRGLTDEQARTRTTASELTLGGLLHHVISNERHWMAVIADLDETAEFDMASAGGEYLMADDETVAGLITEWEEVARSTTDALSTLDLDVSVPVPTAPWAPERIWQSARFTVLHILREISQHAGHADIIREELDGASTTQTWAAAAGMSF